MAPQTGYEQRGDWTTLPEETAFLEQIATETSAIHSVIGTSRVNDHPLHRIDIGTGTENTLVVVGLQHGDEPAGREAALIFARDLAYTSDPTVLDYLTTHRVVILPTMMPDGHPDSRSAGGTDINRTHFNLVPPESRAMSLVFAEVRPQIIVDLHEYEYPTNDEDGPDHLSSVSRFPSRAPVLAEAGANLHASTRAALTAKGWSTGIYGTWSPSTLSSAGSAYHAVTMLSESHRTSPLPERVQMTLDLLWHVVERHHQDAAYFAAASNGSREYARTTTDPYELPTSTTASPIITIDPIGYEVEGPIPQRLAAFGIEVVDGYVDMNQDARPAIPMLLDPESFYAINGTTRVDRPSPPEPLRLYRTDGTAVTMMRTDGTPVRQPQ